MAEDAELIGGISVSIGASHAKLVSDLAEADRLIESWAAKVRNANVGVNVSGPAAAAGTAGPASGGGVAVPGLDALGAKIDRLATVMARGGGASIRQQRAEAESVTINGVKIGGLSQQSDVLQKAIAEQIGPVEVPVSVATEKIGPMDVPVEVQTDQIEAAATQVKDLQVTSEKPISLVFDTKALQTELQAVLATLKEIVTVAGEAAKAGALSTVPGSTGARRPRAAAASTRAAVVTGLDVGMEEFAEGEEEEAPPEKRRKNIKDRGLGTEADQGRIYTYGGAREAGFVEPGPAQQGQSYTSGEDDEYTQQQALAEAAAARKRELTQSRRDQQARAAQATEDRQALANAQRADERARRIAATSAGSVAGNGAQADRARLEQLSAEAAAANAAPPQAPPPQAAPPPITPPQAPAQPVQPATPPSQPTGGPAPFRNQLGRINYTIRNPATNDFYSDEEGHAMFTPGDVFREDAGAPMMRTGIQERGGIPGDQFDPGTFQAWARTLTGGAAREREALREPTTGAGTGGTGALPPNLMDAMGMGGAGTAEGGRPRGPLSAEELAELRARDPELWHAVNEMQRGMPTAGTPPPTAGTPRAPVFPRPAAGGAGGGTPPPNLTGAPPAPGPGPDRRPPLTDMDRQAAADRQRAEEAARMARERPAEPYLLPDERPTRRGGATDEERENVAQGQRAERQRQSFEERQQRGLNARQFQEAEIVRRQEQQQATQQAAITAAGRTARTTASGFGAFFGGPRREQIEAQAALTAAQKETASATRYRNIFENELIRNEVRATGASREEARQLRDTNRAIRESTQYRGAIEDQTKAIEGEGKATERVAKLSQGFGTAARSLLSVTAAGAAFGIGLKVVDFGIQAASKALSELVDVQTGFGSTSTRVTAELGKQTLAFRGNVEATLAQAEAQAGISASSSALLDTQLRLTTQIKAGAQAQEQASELFKAGYGEQNAPSGLYGGYGGVAGTALFGEQLGGGKGFTEQLFKDTQGFAGGGGPDLLQNFNQGLTVASTNLPEIVGQFGGLGKQIADLTKLPGVAADVLRGGPPPEQAAGPGQQQEAYLNDLNAAATRGQKSLGDSQQATAAYTTSAKEVAQAAQAAAQAGDAYGVMLANQYGIVLRLDGAVVKAGADYEKAAQQFAVGRGIQDPAQIGRLALAQERQRQVESAASIDALKSQQAYARPGFISNVGRQQGIAEQNIEVQSALANLANPPTPVGTGRVAANAKEQAQIKRETYETTQIQDELNMGYEVGRQLLVDTYKPAIVANFGAEAGRTFDTIIGQISATGAAMAKIQAGISNKQAAYQTAQYNYQLFIARRTLSDIGGLTGKNFGAGKSYLGVLEGQNLALSRQAQLLQFGLSQRQINFQKAIAGFTVPGLTPAEQNARVQEAKIEADYAQKQLDIQKKMFGNQVKIVDISNLRQGADLLKQISLLQQGRQLTIDIQGAQEKLERLNKQQDKLVARAGTYITAINEIIAKASSDMAAQEAILGRSLTKFEAQAVTAMYHIGNAFFRGLVGGILSMGGAATSLPTNTGGKNYASKPGADGPDSATGNIFMTQGSTSLGPYGTAGEAGGEVVAILSHPKALTSGFGGGDGDVSVNFYGDNVFNTEADFQKMYRMVLAALGRDAATKGLRTPF